MKKLLLVLIILCICISCKGQTESKPETSVATFKYLSDKELQSKSAEELRFLRNEVYARKGYVFKSDEFNQYFKTKSWYKPNSNISLTLTDQENTYISKIKNLEKKVDDNSSIVNCIDFYHVNNSKVYPLSGAKIENEDLPNGLIDIELSHNNLKPDIKEILFDGSIFNLNCEENYNYRFIITAYPNENLHSYLIVGNLIEIKKLYGSFGSYDDHQEYDFVLDHKDLEITIESWQRYKKISTSVEKYKLTDQGLIAL
ncbi:YARHG domain-containing protein [Aquimarina longa]|uniref:YARHG domain-containing protein n=1 Tax=Aquimarina longa TaxID=1080221 RepID=UPI000785DB26|nr:YARHG domain-containing protein [Aquimarina longa]